MEVLPPPQPLPSGDALGLTEKTSILLTPAIAALLATSVAPPVTVLEPPTTIPTSAVLPAQSIAPENLAATTILHDITSKAASVFTDEDDDDDFVLSINGTEMTDLALVYTDEDGNEVSIPAAKIIDFLDEEGEGMPPGYVMSGKIKLFGIIPATLYINYGTAISPMTWIEEYVKISDHMSLGSLIPHFKDSEELNAIQLRNTQLNYVSMSTLTTFPGMWLETDVEFSGPLQPISDALESIFGQTNPGVHMKALISRNDDWDEIPEPPGIDIWGSLENTSVKLGDMEITRLAVEITGQRVLKQGPKPKMQWEFGWGFAGSALMTLPGSITPLEMNLLVRKSGSFLSFSMNVESDGGWEDALGIPGLYLHNVDITAQVPVQKPSFKTMSFGLTATMTFGDASFFIAGSHSQGETALTASLSSFTLADLIYAVEDLFDIDLEEPDFEVEFRDLVFNLSSKTGIVLAGEVIVDGYQSTRGIIAVSKAGISITGAISDVKIGEVNVKSASINVSLPLTRSKSPSPDAVHHLASFSIAGTVEFGDLEISAGVYFSKGPPAGGNVGTAATSSQKTWIIYGELKDKDGMKSRELLPALEGSFLDFSLRNIAFVASNSAMSGGTPDGFFNTFNYPIKKGVQLYAAFDSVKQIDSLTRADNPPLTLQASYSTGVLGLDIIFPNPSTAMVFKNPNIRTTPFTMGIRISDGGPCLALKAGFELMVPNQFDPLAFNFGLNADIVGANGFGEMKGYWKNPLGISDQLEIGDLALQVGIIYGVFFTTGTPSTIAISGGIKYGKTAGAVALSISENPGELLVSSRIKNLGIDDIMDFARKATKLPLPVPDADFLKFEDMSLYMSTGVTIGTTYYAPGISASGSIVALGKRAQMALTMGYDGVMIKGTMDVLEVGPLSIRGRRGPNPMVDIVMNATTHKVLVDGQVQLGPLLAGIYLNALQEGTGDMTLDFDAEMAFSDLFRMSARAKARTQLKNIAQGNLRGIEFDVRAEMQQDIVNYVMAQVNSQLLAAQYAATEGFDKARAALDEAERRFRAGVDNAQKELDKAQGNWRKKSDDVNKAFNDAKKAQEKRVAELKEDVRRKKVLFDAAVDLANRRLEQAQINASSEIGRARGHLESEKAKVDRDINNAQNTLINAEQDMNRRFGNAKRDIENAQNNVANAKRNLDDIARRIREKEDQKRRANVFMKIKYAAELVPLGAEYGVKYAAFETANGILSAAKAIMMSAGYKLAETAMFTARSTLEASKIGGKLAIEAASQTLNGVIIAQNGLVDTAQAALTRAKTASEELRLWQMAEAALDQYQRQSIELISGLQKGVDGLMSTSEFIAFETAKGALKVANENFGDMDILRKGVDVAEKSASTGIKIASWATKQLGNLFDIEKIVMTAQLSQLHSSGKFSAQILGDVANQTIDLTVSFTLGSPKEFVEEIFEKVWDDIETAVIEIFD